ncbi:MAG: LptE family protein [Candidatus Omnitrophica bacterium]|nr:LptE family protein [Candidatus Omnitrophota bacterium]
MTILVSAGLGFSGCGYTSHTTLPQNMQTIYVDTVKNKIPIGQIYAYQPGLEIDITNALIKRLHRDGNLRVTTREQADVILESNLLGFEQEGLRFTGLESVAEYRLFIVLSLKLTDRKTGQLLWEESNFTGDTEYFVSQVRSIAREEASRRAVDRLARNVVDRIVEDW